MVIPVIERVAPQLSGSAEIIWRHSGYAGRVALRIELEQLLVCPDIGAVECDEDRDITDDLDAFFMSIVAQCDPLLLKDKLDEAIVTDLFFQLFRVRLFRLVGRI